MGPTLLNESPLKITSAAAAGATPWTATAGGPLTPDATWWSGLFEVSIAGNVLFCNIFFQHQPCYNPKPPSPEYLLLLHPHLQHSSSTGYSRPDVHVGNPCVLTFAATNLSHSSTERGNVNYRLSKVHVLHKYMDPKLFLGSSMNSNIPPPLNNPPWLSSYTAPHIPSWKEEHILVSVYKLWFLPFLSYSRQPWSHNTSNTGIKTSKSARGTGLKWTLSHF